VRAGIDEDLYDYLKACEFNKRNENHFPNAAPIFDEIDQVKIAEQGTIDLDLHAEVFNVLKDLRTKTSKGYMYDDEGIDTICKLLNIQSAGLSSAQKLQTIVAQATADPKKFLSFLVDDSAKVAGKVRQAIELQLIHVDAEGLKWSEDST